MAIFDLFRSSGGHAPLYLHNTLTGGDELFDLPKSVRYVRMYNCGPTVYGKQHIGNLSMYVFTDVLRRTLIYNGFGLRHVINITDVGHLSSDADSGDDKMSLGLKREGLELTLKNMRALAEKFTSLFLADLEALNIQTEGVRFPRASDYVEAQIAMIRTLEEKGYAYATRDGVYFDTSRFPHYGELGAVDRTGLKEGARVAISGEKYNPADFALWKFDAKIGWSSPWGQGFPGWHIECSAMIRALLGQQIDIHTGGIEHIPIHHNNEIAQSECATGKRPLSRFWLHRAHLQLEGAKIAKSEGNVVYLSDVAERGFHALSMRYLLLTSHYRTPANFTWPALEAAQRALGKLVNLRLSIDGAPGRVPLAWKAEFTRKLNQDLDTPGALAVIWEMARDKSLSAADLLAALLDFDSVLGLTLENPDAALRRLARAEISPSALPAVVQTLLEERDKARTRRDWKAADELRAKIAAAGYSVDDTPEGQRASMLGTLD